MNVWLPNKNTVSELQSYDFAVRNMLNFAEVTKFYRVLQNQRIKLCTTIYSPLIINIPKNRLL
jgi:hypothetical protein